MPFKVHNWPLNQLPGLSEENVARLQRLGLETTQDLLVQADSPDALQALATRLSLPLRYPQKWVALARFSQLPSVGCQYCGLLLHSGIASIPQLATVAPGQLYNRVRRLHTATLRRSDLCPTADQVVQWVREAQHVLKSP